MLSGLASALVGLIVVALVVGAAAIAPSDLLAMLARRLGLNNSPSTLADSVLSAVRIPRVVAALGAGAGLSVAGVGLHATLHNRMADPHLIGVAPMAGIGALCGLAVSGAGSGTTPMVVGAVLGAIIGTFAIKVIGRRVLDTNEFVLVGLALGFGVLGVLGAVTSSWDNPRVPSFNFWVFGGLGGATWHLLVVAIPVILSGITLIAASHRPLDLLSLGEAEARYLGVDVPAVLRWTSCGIGLAVGGAVGLGGAIGFVGLVGPAVARRLVGPGHRWLIPTAALAGASAVLALDTAARTVAAPIEIPVGLLTAIVGAPVLIRLLVARHRPTR